MREKASNIRRKIGNLLTQMYKTGKEDSMEDILLIKEEAYEKGFDAGYDKGYEAAMIEFRMPDL